MSDVVSIETIGQSPIFNQRLLQEDGNRALARTGEPGQPDRNAALAENVLAMLPGDSAAMPSDIAWRFTAHRMFALRYCSDSQACCAIHSSSNNGVLKY